MCSWIEHRGVLLESIPSLGDFGASPISSAFVGTHEAVGHRGLQCSLAPFINQVLGQSIQHSASLMPAWRWALEHKPRLHSEALGVTLCGTARIRFPASQGGGTRRAKLPIICSTLRPFGFCHYHTILSWNLSRSSNVIEQGHDLLWFGCHVAILALLILDQHILNRFQLQLPLLLVIVIAQLDALLGEPWLAKFW